MHGTEVGVFSFSMSNPQKNAPASEKQLRKTLLLTAPAFFYQDRAADPGLG